MTPVRETVVDPKAPNAPVRTAEYATRKRTRCIDVGISRIRFRLSVDVNVDVDSYERTVDSEQETGNSEPLLESIASDRSSRKT